MPSISRGRLQGIRVAFDLLWTLFILLAAWGLFFISLGNRLIGAGLGVMLVGEAVKRLIAPGWRRADRAQIIRACRMFAVASAIGGALVGLGTVLLNNPVGWVFAALSFAWVWMWFWLQRDFDRLINLVARPPRSGERS